MIIRGWEEVLRAVIKSEELWVDSNVVVASAEKMRARGSFCLDLSMLSV